MSASKLKVGFVFDDSLDKPDGVQQYILTVGEWLQTRGHDVHYLVGHTTRRDVARVHSLSRNLDVRFNKNRMSIPLPADRDRLQRVFDDHIFDVLHIQMPFSPWLAGRVIEIAPPQTAVVGTFHIAAYGPSAQLGGRVLAAWQRANLKRFDAICSVSAAAQNYAERYFGITSSIIPNTIDCQRFIAPTPPTSPRTVRLVFLGRLVPRKGCAQFLQALAALPVALQTQLDVTIAGRGPQAAALKRFVRRKRLDHFVHFTGFVDEADKAQLLASAHIAVFPSLGGESFGIVLLEAMAAGVQVIVAGDNPGYQAVLGGLPSLLVEPRNTKLFAKRLAEFITSPSQRADIQRQLHRLVRRYDVHVVGPRIEDFYTQAIAKRRRTLDNRSK